jgi:signal recognition particle GTPase
LNKHHLLKFGSIIKPKSSKKRKTSKKKKHAKGGISESKPNKHKSKGHSSEPVSEESSLKRKQKNMSSSPRNNNIENLMNQFLVMKNQNNQNEFIKKYGENLTMPEFSKEQTSSILNISSQGGSNMSFIN